MTRKLWHACAFDRFGRAAVALIALAACDASEESSAEATAGSGGTAGQAGAGGMGMGGAGGAATLETIEVVTWDGRPAANVDVIASAPDGSLVEHAQTSIGGSVALDVPYGGSVAVLHSYSQLRTPTNQVVLYRTVQSFHLVPDGGAVRATVGPLSPPAMPPSNLPMTLSIDVTAVWSAVTQLHFAASCHGGTFFSDPLTNYSYDGCPGSSMFDLLVTGRNATGQVVAFDLIEGLLFTPGGIASIQSQVLQTSLATTNLTVNNLPPGTDLWIDGSAYKTATMLAHRENRVLQDVSGTQSFELRFPSTIRNVFDAFSLSASFATGASGGAYRSKKFSFVQPVFQWDAAALALVEDAQLDIGVPEQMRLGWTLAADGARRVISTNVYWSRTQAEVGYWTTYAPAAELDAVSFPELPAGLEDFYLTAGDQLADNGVNHYDTPYEAALSDGWAALVNPADFTYAWREAQP